MKKNRKGESGRPEKRSEEKSQEKPQGKPQGKPTETRNRRPFDPWRDNIEAIAVAVVLALIIRHFSLEAFEIPTGSMAPTLFGIHAWVTCPNCKKEFNFGLQSDSATGKLKVRKSRKLVYRGTCPQCKLPHNRHEKPFGVSLDRKDSFTCPFDRFTWVGSQNGTYEDEVIIDDSKLDRIECPICWFKFQDVVKANTQCKGNKILVNKFAYKFGEPQRWDVIVFQFNRETNYIKRLIAKPGEALLIMNGNIYIDGKIERKHTQPEIQESLWTMVANSDRKEGIYQKVPAWEEQFPGNPGSARPAGAWTWNQDTSQWSVNTSRGSAEKVVRLEYKRPLRNYYHYNLLSPGAQSGMNDQVGDKKIVFTASPPRRGRGWIGVEMRSGKFAFQARIPLGDPDPANPAALYELPVKGDQPLATATVALKPDQKNKARVEFEHVDDRVCLRIDGEEIFFYEYDTGGDSPRTREENTIFLLAGDGADCVLESIQVYRDVYYTRDGNTQNAVKKSFKLESNGLMSQYFPCGDNSPSSYDGRYWGSLPEKNLMGKAFVVFWPIWWKQWQIKFIR